MDGEVRVHRSCGFVPNVGSTADRDCFTRTGTHQVAFCKSSIISEPGKAYMLSLYWQPFPSDQRLPLRVQRGLLQQVLTSRLPLPNPPSISSSSPSFHLFPVQPNLFHKYSKPSLKPNMVRNSLFLPVSAKKQKPLNCKSLTTCTNYWEKSFRWRLAWCASSLGDLSSLMSANYLLKLFSCQNNLQSPIPAEKLSNLRWFWQIWGKLFPIILVKGFLWLFHVVISTFSRTCG